MTSASQYKHVGKFSLQSKIIYIQEFVDAPVLFAEGTTRFDIGQGRAGTCWFLSILAALGDREDVIKQVIGTTLLLSART